MDFGRLRTLVAVVDAGSFTAAARSLGLTQPAVSLQMASLERSLGLPLFERQGRRRAPTEAALALASSGRRALSAVAEAERLAAELRGLERGVLRVGASTTPGVYVVPAALGAFGARYPGVEPRLEIADTGEVERRLRDRAVDLAVVGEYEAAEDLVLAPLRPDDLVPICGPRHPLAAARRPALRRFLAEPFLAREPGSSTREVFVRWLAKRGHRLAPAMEFGATEAIKQAVAAGLGVSVVSDASVALELEAGLLRSPAVPGFPIRRRIDVALLRGRRLPRPAAAFLELLMGARAATALVRRAAAG